MRLRPCLNLAVDALLCCRSFTPTVACIAACILAFFLAFVEYEHPEGTAEQVTKREDQGKGGGVHWGTLDRPSYS